MGIDNLLDQVLKISKATDKAQTQLNKTVNYYRKSIMDDAVNTLRKNPKANIKLFGIKDTNQIPTSFIEKLQQTEGFIFHTVDTMAEGGRAIDIKLTNPLTGKVMTGSSSGSCINVLLGINDFAIGTDGGGSVLAPAISCGLYSIMGKGLGLRGSIKRQSTDNIEFHPGLGIISNDLELCKEAVLNLIEGNKPVNNLKYKVAIPKNGTNILPSGIDMFDLIERIIQQSHLNLEVVEIKDQLPQERNTAISLIKDIFEEEVDLIITAEGPIDYYNLGDSVLGQWGKTGQQTQQNSGKYLVKVANMVNATALSIPTEELATSIVLIAPQGIPQGLKAIDFAEKISLLYKRPQLFNKYFFESYKNNNKGFLDNF
ncbi:amidase [Alkalicella caledoniensis]|uniref:Amidase n=1 Tax=Alkalicella caledoniensis TaxID=2731377 RepID=A0A7G9W418_ALKCA|nr:amidase family protein [Alkalicella caledoniensis]QNO13430.1 amidase [Alkalicella caledoniensis]